MNTYIKHKRPQVNLNVLQQYTLTSNRQRECWTFTWMYLLINYTLMFWGQNIFQRARICASGKIGLIALHWNFMNLGLFMLNTVPGSWVKSCMYVQDRCTIIAKYFIYNFTNTTSLLWSGNRTKTLNYSEVAIMSLDLSLCRKLYSLSAYRQF